MATKITRSIADRLRRLRIEHSGFRALISMAVWAYAALLLLLLALLEWQAERRWFLTVLLFAPPQLFLFPCVILGPAVVVARRWIEAAVLAGCSIVTLFGYMHCRMNSETRSGDSFTIVTHNAGEDNRQQFGGFLDQVQPDVIVLQDAKNRLGDLTKQFPGYYGEARGEFVCLSKTLIQQAQLLREPAWNGRPVAARFVVVQRGKLVTIYSIHMPTPRAQLARLLGARTAIAVFGNEELPGGRARMGDWNERRLELYDSLGALLKKETGPFVAAGDFNMPDHGLAYHRLKNVMTDSFMQAGSSYGFTFPGNMRSLASLLRPWLRIDYVFTGGGLKAQSCFPEPGLRSQHRAVAARIFAAG